MPTKPRVVITGAAGFIGSHLAETLLDRGYTANAAARGKQLQAGLRELADHHVTLANVRGLGLMTAVDILDPVERSFAPALREDVIQTCFRQGLLLLHCGESGIRFCPPLCVTAEQVETCLRILDGVLTVLSPGGMPGRESLGVVAA